MRKNAKEQLLDVLQKISDLATDINLNTKDIQTMAKTRYIAEYAYALSVFVVKYIVFSSSGPVSLPTKN